MALVEQDVRHVMITGIDDQSTNPSDIPVGRMHVIATAYLHLTHRYTVLRDLWTVSTSSHAHTPSHAAHPDALQTAHRSHARHAKSEVRQRAHLIPFIAPLADRSRQQLGLVCLLENFELGHRHVQPDLLRCRRRHAIDRDNPANLVPMSRFDDKMRYRAGYGINDDASQLAAAAVATSD